jgi:hypothetical protein
MPLLIVPTALLALTSLGLAVTHHQIAPAAPLEHSWLHLEETAQAIAQHV